MRALPLFILAAAACAGEPQVAENGRLRATYDPVARTFSVTDVRAGRTWTTLSGAELPDNALHWRLDGAELVIEINLPPETPQPRPIAFPGPFRAEKGEAGTENPFVDVPADQWYTEAVLWAVANGVTNGVDETHFAPMNDCTRAQIVTLLYRAEA